jgi:hypothetical protein
VGARSELVAAVVTGSEVASLSELLEMIADRGVAPPDCAWGAVSVGKFVDWMRGDEVVRNSRCDGCVDSGEGVSKGLFQRRI